MGSTSTIPLNTGRFLRSSRTPFPRTNTCQIFPPPKREGGREKKSFPDGSLSGAGPARAGRVEGLEENLTLSLRILRKHKPHHLGIRRIVHFLPLREFSFQIGSNIVPRKSV